MPEKKVYTEKVVNNFINKDTGELLETSEAVKHHSIVVPDKEAFAFQYAAIIGAIKSLSGRDIKILTYCAINASTETNAIHITKHVLEDIANTFNSSIGSVRNGIRILKEKQILSSLGKGSYIINPRYYWKGSSVGRNKALKYILTLEYNK